MLSRSILATLAFLLSLLHLVSASYGNDIGYGVGSGVGGLVSLISID